MIHPTAKVGPGCVIGPDVVIGAECEVQEGVRLEAVTLLQGVRVQANSFVKNSLLGWSSQIGKWCHVLDSVFGEAVEVRDSLLVRGATVLMHWNNTVPLTRSQKRNATFAESMRATYTKRRVSAAILIHEATRQEKMQMVWRKRLGTMQTADGADQHGAMSRGSTVLEVSYERLILRATSADEFRAAVAFLGAPPADPNPTATAINVPSARTGPAQSGNSQRLHPVSCAERIADWQSLREELRQSGLDSTYQACALLDSEAQSVQTPPL